jgi:hypothetical protein
MPTPLALSDSQIATLMAAARPLQPRDRDSFCREVTAVLQTQPVLGDGVVARVCREVVKRYFDPPLEREHTASKWSRDG